MRDKIKKLLNSNITGYRIAQDTGVSEAVISKLRNGKRNLDDVTLLTAEKLSSYYDSVYPSK